MRWYLAMGNIIYNTTFRPSVCFVIYFERSIPSTYSIARSTLYFDSTSIYSHVCSVFADNLHSKTIPSHYYYYYSSSLIQPTIYYSSIYFLYPLFHFCCWFLLKITYWTWFKDAKLQWTYSIDGCCNSVIIYYYWNVELINFW